jgi:hypothetical protein
VKKKRLLTDRGELMFENKMTWEQQEVFRLLKSHPGTIYQEADETERHVIRDWVRGLLNVSEITVTFVKADGTLRDMRCTLDQDRIPPQPPKPEKPAKELSVDGLRQNGFLGEAVQKEVTKPEENHTQKVFDLDASAWRSFRYDRLRKVTATIGFE